MALVTIMPWWGGYAFAVLAYLWLHSLTTHEAVTTVGPGQISSMVTNTFRKALASVGQYLLPLLCLTGAAMSAYGRHKRRALLSNAAGSPTADALNKLSWQKLQLLVGEELRQQGFQSSPQRPRTKTPAPPFWHALSLPQVACRPSGLGASHGVGAYK